MNILLKDKKIKEFLFPVITIALLIILLFYFERKNELEPKVFLTAKVTGYKLFNKSEYYLIYKYWYNNKLYKGYKSSHGKNVELIDNCFEVIIYKSNPNNSELNLNKKSDCKLWK